MINKDPINFELVAENCLRQAESLLRQWLPDGKVRGDEYVAFNPTRNDKHLGSFCINMQTGAWGDFSTNDRGGDLISLYAYLNNTNQATAALKLSNDIGYNTMNEIKLEKTNGKKFIGHAYEMPSIPIEHPELGVPNNIWAYKDSQSKIMFYICRFDHENGKNIRPLSLWSNNGKDEWLWRHMPASRPLYNLPDILGFLEKPILIVEGEKSVDAAQKIFPEYTVTTSSGGSHAASNTDWSFLSEREVLIWPDADAAGKRYAENIIIRLKNIGVKSINIISTDNLPEKYDAADALNDATSINDIRARIKNIYSAGSKKKSSHQQELLDKFISNLKLNGLGGEQISQKEVLLNIIEHLELYHDNQKNCYASIVFESPILVFLQSTEFKYFLGYIYYKLTNLHVSEKILNDVIDAASSIALFERDKVEVSYRMAHHGNKIYIDVADDENNIIEVDSNGWRIINNSPVFFIRTPYTQSLALPVTPQGNHIEEFWRLINVSERDRVLILSWLVGCYGDIQYPILILHGQQGSGKTTLTRILKTLIDPNVCDTNCTPKDHKNLIAFAIGNHLLAIDNNSYISGELSDDLCRISLGCSVNMRKLYKNSEEIVYKLRKPIILNGINNNIHRGDLLDRSMIVELSSIVGKARVTESQIFEKLKTLLPSFSGLVFDCVVKALRNKDVVHITQYPRMADYSHWCYASFLDGKVYDSEFFISRYRENIEEAVYDLLAEDPLGIVIIEFVKINHRWSGTSASLLESLNRIALGEVFKRSAQWPSDPASLGKALNRLSPLFASHGISISRKRSNGQKKIFIHYADPGYPLNANEIIKGREGQLNVKIFPEKNSKITGV